MKQAIPNPLMYEMSELVPVPIMKSEASRWRSIINVMAVATNESLETDPPEWRVECYVPQKNTPNK